MFYPGVQEVFLADTVGRFPIMLDCDIKNKFDQKLANELRYEVLFTAIASLSMFGSVAIIVTYFLFKDLQTTSRKILVCISVGDFFTVYPSLVYRWRNRTTTNSLGIDCEFQSFVATTAVMWSFFWTSTLAIFLYVALVKKRHDMAEKLMVIFHIINWGIPLFLVGAAWCANVLGNDHALTSGGWCWIKPLHEHWRTILWMLACGKLWEIASYFVDGLLYFIIRRKIKEEIKEWPPHMSDEAIQTALQGERKFTVVPILFVFLRLWGTIRFFIYCISPSASLDTTLNKVLLICHIIGDSSQGFVNFILFCILTEKFRENVKRVFSCRKRSTERERDSLIPKTDEDKPSVHKYVFKDPGPITFYT